MMTSPPGTENPYVGPRPFERGDRGRFFGRDREAEELLSLIIAHRSLLFYAPSGAGKTSLLNARVTPLLEAEGFEIMPFARVQGPELAGISLADIPNIYVFYTLLTWAGDELDPARLAQLTLADFLAQRPAAEDAYGYPAPRLIIFDQFEELFTTYPQRWQDREGFFNQLSQALAADPLLRLVFSMREDYVALLDAYADLLPKSMGARYRLERMRPAAALAAVRQPLVVTEREFETGVAEQLVEELRKIRVESRAGQVETIKGEFIEPVQLQVVCQGLWADLPAEVTRISRPHLQEFGNVDQALSAFYERALARAAAVPGIEETGLRRWFDQTLITPAGTRGTVYRGAAETGGVPNAAIDALENAHLIRGEWRAGARWYELTHDRLIDPIQDANRRWTEARREARARRIRRIAGIGGGLLLLLLLSIVLAQYLLASLRQSQAEASASTRTAQLELAARQTAEADVAAERATAAFLATADLAAAQTAEANAQATSNALSTIEVNARSTADARATADVQATQTAVAQMTAQAIAQATADAQATATAWARATVDAQATFTAAELERLSQPVRPLRPGISIGNQNAGSAGTLSAIVQGSDGTFFLLGPQLAMGAADAPILQPSPIDGGKPADAIAVTARRAAIADLGTPDASFLINIARLMPGIPFETTIPGLGPLRGLRQPAAGTSVIVVGRTSGLVPGELTRCEGGCLNATRAESFSSEWAVDASLSPGDEGALVVDQEGYAVGIVAHMAQFALMAPLPELLDRFDAELVVVGRQIARLEGHRDMVTSLAFSPDGQTLASASWDRDVRLWRVADEFASTRLAGHREEVLSVAFSHDGLLLASGSSDQTVRLWDLANPAAEPLLLSEPGDSVRIVAFRADDQQLAVASMDGLVYLYEKNVLDQQQQQQQEFFLTQMLLGHKAAVLSAAFSPDGQRLASGDAEGLINLWDLSEPDPVPMRLLGHDDGTFVTSVAFSPDGRSLASAGADKWVLLWDLAKDPPPWRSLSDHTERVDAVAFSPDGQTLVSAGWDGTIRLWQLADLEAPPLILRGHQSWVTSLAFSPDGRWLVSGSLDTTIRIWQMR